MNTSVNRNTLRALGAVALILAFGLLSATGQEDAPPELKQRDAAQETEEQADKLVLPAGTQIPLILQNTINTRNAQKGDRVYFETLYPIIHAGKVIIPVGSYVRGTLTRVKRPGRIKGRAQIYVRFDDMTLPNGYTVNLNASLANAGTTGNQEVDRTEGGIKSEGTKGEDVSTVLKTTGTGAGIGAIATRTRSGAGTGALIGAAAGLATVLFTRGKELILPRGTSIEITLDRPLPLDPALVKFDWTDYSSTRRNR